MIDATVGEMVAQTPERSRVFQAFGIGFCCQGSKTLGQACVAAGVPLATVLRELDALEHGHATADVDPAVLSVPELIDHIIECHHGYLRSELPRLHQMAERVARVHGEREPVLEVLLEVFVGLRNELNDHMLREERALFPALRELALGEGSGLVLNGPISRMMQEHVEVAEQLARLRDLTCGYHPPADACNTYRALFSGLQELRGDLDRHMYLEDDVLFPAAFALVDTRT